MVEEMDSQRGNSGIGEWFTCCSATEVGVATCIVWLPYASGYGLVPDPVTPKNHETLHYCPLVAIEDEPVVCVGGHIENQRFEQDLSYSVCVWDNAFTV